MVRRPPPPPPEEESLYEDQPVPTMPMTLPQRGVRQEFPEQDNYDDFNDQQQNYDDFDNPTENYDDFTSEQSLYDEFHEDSQPPPRKLSQPGLNNPLPPLPPMPRLPPIPKSNAQQSYDIQETYADPDDENPAENYDDFNEDKYPSGGRRLPMTPAKRNIPQLPPPLPNRGSDNSQDDSFPPPPPSGPPLPPPISALPNRDNNNENRYRPSPQPVPRPQPAQNNIGSSGGGIDVSSIQNVLGRLKKTGHAVKDINQETNNNEPNFKDVLKPASERKLSQPESPPMDPPPWKRTLSKKLVEKTALAIANADPPKDSRPVKSKKPDMLPEKRNLPKLIIPTPQNSAYVDDKEIYDDATSDAPLHSPKDPVLGPKDPFLYRWYHGNIERDETLRKLRKKGGSGTFLVRKSTKGGPSQPYTMTILYHDTPVVLKIRLRSDQKVCLGSEKADEMAFANVAELVAFHEKEDITLIGKQSGQTKLIGYPER